MPLIADRPQSWNQVLGQTRAILVLHALLRQPQYMTRGYIFEGPRGVGKTSTAYLFARALMCMGDNPLGCGDCPSCRTMDQAQDQHPSLQQVDAAAYSGVDKARELLDQLYGGATLGRRRVVIVDEAHRLSKEAFDVFLKPLEERDTDVVFIFVSSRGDDIPVTIDSRCARLRFVRVADDALIGRVMSLADQRSVKYTRDGLRALVRYAEGRPRDAVKAFGIVAALGSITPETVETALNQNVRSSAQAVFQAIVDHKGVEATHLADELAQRIGPAKTVEALFVWYAEDAFTENSVTGRVAPLRSMTTFFLKWSDHGHLPADVIPLFIAELEEVCGGNTPTPEESNPASESEPMAAPQQLGPMPPPSPKPFLTVEQLLLKGAK